MLPGGSSRVGDNLFVRRENSKTVFKGLADQHAVKRIFVVMRQDRLVQRVGFLQGQSLIFSQRKVQVSSSRFIRPASRDHRDVPHTRRLIPPRAGDR